ncbi:unnamed protein product, partial [Ectocarpus sp. 12 AP-2014]
CSRSRSTSPSRLCPNTSSSDPGRHVGRICGGPLEQGIFGTACLELSQLSLCCLWGTNL